MEAAEAGRNLLDALRTKKPGTRNPEPGTRITHHAPRITSPVRQRTPFPALTRAVPWPRVWDMNKLKIIAYLKPSCGWSQGVRAILRKYDLPYEDRDIINDPAQRQEMIEKSGQMLSPCVEVNGRMLPDISGEEVEAFLLANGLVQTNERPADAPTNQPCAHEMPQAMPMEFRR